LLGSSSLWFNEFYLGSDLKDLPDERFQNVKKVYLSVGENKSWEMLKGFATPIHIRESMSQRRGQLNS